MSNSSSLSGEDPKEVLSYIQDARQIADRLLHDVPRLEWGKLTVAPQEVQLREVTESVLAELSPLIQEKGHRLSFVRAGIVIDELALRRTLSGEFWLSFPAKIC